MKLKQNLEQFIVMLKRLYIGLFMLTLALMQMGCNSLPGPLRMQSAPANLTTLCSDLDRPLSGQSKDVLVWSLQTIEAYKVCKDRHKALVEAWPK